MCISKIGNDGYSKLSGDMEKLYQYGMLMVSEISEPMMF